MKKACFQRVTKSNWIDEKFLFRRVKSIWPWTYVIDDFSGDETEKTIYEKELQKINQSTCRIQKAIKGKGYMVYVKWKDYYNPFNI